MTYKTHRRCFSLSNCLNTRNHCVGSFCCQSHKSHH